MKRLLASMVLIVATSALAGCYYDPGYSYVRHSSVGGDAYYGQGGAAYQVAPSYYGGYYGGYYPSYYSGYYGGYGGYGCCYAPGVTIGVSRGWYGGQHDRGYRDGHYRGYRDGRDHGYRGNGNATRTRAAQSRQQPARQQHAAPHRGADRSRGRGERDPNRQ
ncbi:MAG TPA: hypothetical protein VFE77_05085 [Rhodanobacter sp.]|nr:hypothetical protein [Rhodanobacter sp.]